MPTYTYRCAVCETISEYVRPIDLRRQFAACRGCGEPAEFVISAPSVVNWNSERKFPNVRKSGDGAMSFPTKAAYEQHLATNNLGEIGIQAKIRRPHGNKVIASWP